MKIGIDLDNTINSDNNSKEFFRIICHLLHPEHEIHIVTSREPGTESDIQNELSELNILYDKIKITDEKADYIKKNNIKVVFENEDEPIQNLGKDILVMKVREDGNYNYRTGCWIGSRKTVEMID